MERAIPSVLGGGAEADAGDARRPRSGDVPFAVEFSRDSESAWRVSAGFPLALKVEVEFLAAWRWGRRLRMVLVAADVA